MLAASLQWRGFLDAGQKPWFFNLAESETQTQHLLSGVALESHLVESGGEIGQNQ